jgi:type II secretory pathway pseudopilin PulG
MGFKNRLFSDQRGVALPLALIVLAAVAALAAAAAASAVTATHQSARDRNVKRAVQAAAAATESSNYQYTRLQPKDNECVAKDPYTGTLTVQPGFDADGWCAAQTEDLGDGASYSVRVSPGREVSSNGQALVERDVLATGIVNGVKRRIKYTTTASTAKPLFATGYAAVSLDSLGWGNTVRADGGVGSNGDIHLYNQATICGNAAYGGTFSTENEGHVCTGYAATPTEQPFVLDPVDQGTAQTVNDNYRITNALSTAKPKPVPSDTCTTCGKVNWNPVTRVLTLTGNATLTLGGNRYSFCQIELSNSAQLKVAVNVTAKIYVDSPEACGGAAGMGSIVLNNLSGIVNLNSDPTTMQLYLVGSPTIPTKIDFANAFASTILMSIYAPYSMIWLHNSVHLKGALAAKSIPMENDSSITFDPRESSITGGIVSVYRSSRKWIECSSSPTGPALDSGC